MMETTVNYKKSILITIMCTLLSLIVVLGIVVLLMVFVFSGSFGNFMYDMGCDSWASALYYRQYQKSGDIMYCYKALNLRISLNDSEEVVAYYEDLIEDDEYSDFLKASRQNVEGMDVGILAKSSMLFEENYLVNNYVKALVSLGEIDKAWEVATTEFASIESVQLKDQGVYSLSWLVGCHDYSQFNSIHGEMDDILINKMQVYFDNAYDCFESNKVVSGDLDKAYLMALGNRIISVGQDIKKVCAELNINDEAVSNNVDKMISVNNVIKELI